MQAFSSIDLILSFPGACYQFSSLFTVRSCVLQLHDTQCSIRIILCLVTKKALAYGKHHFHTLQASESALKTKLPSNKRHPLSPRHHQGVPAQQMCDMQFETVKRKYMTFHSVGNQCRWFFYLDYNCRLLHECNQIMICGLEAKEDQQGTTSELKKIF